MTNSSRGRSRADRLPFPTQTDEKARDESRSTPSAVPKCTSFHDLPREIRDQIYHEYLSGKVLPTRSVGMRQGRRFWEPSSWFWSHPGVKPVDASTGWQLFHQADDNPTSHLHELLAVNRQIRAEYQHALCLHAPLHVEIDVGVLVYRYPYTLADELRRQDPHGKFFALAVDRGYHADEHLPQASHTRPDTSAWKSTTH